MSDRPLISVVMLCYNHERYIGEALAGLFAQTYSPLDIVIVDDCSPDRSADIVTAKLAEHPGRSGVRFIRHPHNLGLLGARETGFRAARGDFVIDICDDDVMKPDMIAAMTDAWLSHNVSLVTANAEYIDANSNSLGRTFRDCDTPADDSFETLARDGANACCFGAGIGVERAVYTTFGMPPAHLENLDIMLPFYAYLLKGARFISQPLLKYRVHDRNTSLSLTAERSDPLAKLRVNERIYYGHMAHAVAMREALERTAITMPDRYAQLAPSIAPLLTIQTVEMAKKLVKTRLAREALERSRAGDRN
jgi:glycosyltransferase involved in cell wall biosynthesis